jgi:16S rRNA (guanine527-N7)-methyltransferase
MSVDFTSVLGEGAERLGLTLSGEATARLALYFVELKKWSKKTNLVSTSGSDEELIENHFLDSLALLPSLGGDDAHLLDIGSGAGFPGLVCKAAKPELTVTLVEPRQKRTVFLGHIARTLGLDGVRLLCCRIEDQERLPSSTCFTHITCRALTEIGSFLKMIERFAAPTTTVISMKGPKWREELAAAGEVLTASPYRLAGEVAYCLPFSRAQRVLVMFSGR